MFVACSPSVDDFELKEEGRMLRQQSRMLGAREAALFFDVTAPAASLARRAGAPVPAGLRGPCRAPAQADERAELARPSYRPGSCQFTLFSLGRNDEAWNLNAGGPLRVNINAFYIPGFSTTTFPLLVPDLGY